MVETQQVANTDRELWRGPDEGNGDYYADSIFVTGTGGIGINCGGHVIVRPLREWHALAHGRIGGVQPGSLMDRLAEIVKLGQQTGSRPEGVVHAFLYTLMNDGIPDEVRNAGEIAFASDFKDPMRAAWKAMLQFILTEKGGAIES